MTLRDLEVSVMNAIGFAGDCGINPNTIPVTLQLDRAPECGGDLWSRDGVELHYDNNGQASGCVLTAWLEDKSLLETPAPQPAEKTTDELLELLPSHLHLARNAAAPEGDRWRIYNSTASVYITPGFPTAHAALLDLSEQIKGRTFH